MSPERKRTLVGYYLRTLYPETYQDAWVNNLDNYSHLTEALERIDDWGPDFLKLNTLTPEHPTFKVFCSLLNASVQFNGNIPPASQAYNEEALDVRQNFEERLWTAVPNADYTPRTTSQPNINTDGELNGLKNQALQILLNTTLKSKLPKLKINALSDLIMAIEHFEQQHEKAKSPSDQKKAKEILTLLKTINKVMKLNVIDIPNEQGVNSRYCILAESAGGVTEKLSVTPRAVIAQQLQNIIDKGGDLDSNEFTQHHQNYGINTQGIIKLPKHGKTTEVQREAIALNISRLLGFTTTQSTMISHDGKAALYVPFDNIQLLQDFAHGENQTVFLQLLQKK